MNTIEKIATDEEKQMALSVAVDSYDKNETYLYELEKIVNHRLVNEKSSEYSDYQLEQQFLLKKKWYREGWSAAYDGRSRRTNPYSNESIPFTEWNHGYSDSYMGLGREY